MVIPFPTAKEMKRITQKNILETKNEYIDYVKNNLKEIEKQIEEAAMNLQNSIIWYLPKELDKVKEGQGEKSSLYEEVFQGVLKPLGYTVRMDRILNYGLSFDDEIPHHYITISWRHAE